MRRPAVVDGLQARADQVPGLRLLATETRRVELVDRSLALGAQALMAMLPFLVVLISLIPQHVAVEVIAQVRHAAGLGGASVRPLSEISGNRVEVHVGVVGILLTLVSATSFSRALQRMYARVFLLSGKRPGKLRASVVWLGAWIVLIVALSLLSHWTGALLTLVLGTLLQLTFWWWTAHLMLLGTRTWSELLPAAIATTALTLVLVRGSAVVMPRYTRSSITQFGSFGLILAIATWLVAFAGIVVTGTLLGRLVAEQAWWQRLVLRMTAVPVS